MGQHRRNENAVDLSGAHILTDQGALSQKHERVAQIIKDYDPNLELAYIPKQERTAFDAYPFAVVHVNPDNGYRYVVMTCKEDEVDERLLAKLFMANVDNNDVIGRLEAEDAARRLMEFKTKMEIMEEKKDFRDSVLKSRKHWYRHNGRVYS
jgi:hypothetical protein